MPIRNRLRDATRLLYGLAALVAMGSGVAGRADVSPSDGLKISGNRILRNGVDFVARGMIFEGFIEPAAWLQECLDKHLDTSGKYCQRHLDSRSYFWGSGQTSYIDPILSTPDFFVGHDALSLAIRNWNINSIRLNVSQAALDPDFAVTDSAGVTLHTYSPSYLSELKALVAAARSRHLIVFLALFPASNRNAPRFLLDRNPNAPLDGASTLAAAKTLAQAFGSDDGVVLELMNEPWQPTPDLAAAWLLWRDGGVLNNPKSPFHGTAFTGVNPEIRAIREKGAVNPIVLQAINGSFEGFPGGIVDPSDKIIYAAHAFMNNGTDHEMNWNLRFGAFSRSHPFIMTAFNETTSFPWCALHGGEAATKYLNFLSRLKLGVIGYAMDTPYSATRDFRLAYDAPFNLEPQCASTNHPFGGVGDLLQRHFLGALGTLPNDPPEILSVDAPAAAFVGSPVSLKIHAMDRDGDPLSYRVWWGDGAGNGMEPAADNVQASNVFQHAFSWPGASGQFNVAVVVFDSRGARASKTVPIRVHSPPVISSIQAPTSVSIGKPATFTVKAWSPEGAALHYRIWWGDGSSPAVSSQDSNQFSHAFLWAGKGGSFHVSAVVLDANGGRATRDFVVKVSP